MNKYHSNLPTLLGLAVFACLLVGCSPGAKLPCPGPGEELTSPNPGEEGVALTLKNNTCMSICLLLVSPNHCEYMDGVNLVKEHPLRSEESVTLDVLPGKYAAWVELCTEEFRADEDLKVYNDYTHFISYNLEHKSAPSCGSSLTIVNNSEVPICKVWISNSGSTYDSWNWIGADYIQPGELLTLSLRSDTYDIRAEACDDIRLRFEGDVQVSGHQTWTVP